MCQFEKYSFADYKPSQLIVSVHIYNVAIVCMYSNPSLLNSLVSSSSPLSVALFDGSDPPPSGIVGVYNLALNTIDADFFLFCHHDITGNISDFVYSCLSLFSLYNIYGCVGQLFNNHTIWTNAIEPTEVDTLDECFFGFFKNSLFSFDLNLIWTNYSQDICLLSRSKGGKSLVLPNSINHTFNIHSPWFKRSGFFNKELSYVHKKWGSFHRT